MEVETLSDDDDFHDPIYDESEIFSHDDHYETNSRQQPLSKFMRTVNVSGRGFERHWHHCVVVFEQDTFILA